VARYLSEEWLAALDEAAQQSSALRSATAGVHLVVQHLVSGTPGGDVSYYVVIDDGNVSFRPGEADEPTVTFRQDHATAVAVAKGELSAQAAFLNGTMAVRGDLTTLAAHGDALTGVDGALDAVRAATEF
jgi:putative sterol carrier protein